MKVLLDSHALFWSILDRDRLSSTASAVLVSKDNDIYASVASAWELAIKVGIGKWPEAKPIVENFEAELGRLEFRLLPITVSHVRAAGMMTSPHRDPFDRLLAAQAIEEGLTLVTADTKLAALGAPTIW